MNDRILERFTDLSGASSFAWWSPCRGYRYQLERRWDDGPLVNFCLLNPSDANLYDNDPTIERQSRRVRGWYQSYGGVLVTNAYALVSTDPKGLKLVADPIGPLNDEAIVEGAKRSAITICGWGGNATLLDRGRKVKALLEKAGVDLYYLRLSKGGIPWHPLYLGYDLMPQRWMNGGVR